MSHTLSIDVAIKDGETLIAQSTEVLTIEAQSRKECIFEMCGLTGIKLWDLEQPNLYTFDVTIRSEDTGLEDSYATRFGFARTSHYPQSRHFLDRCDEIGLLVLEEIPGWQYIGNEVWKQVACDNVREMIERDWDQSFHYCMGDALMNRRTIMIFTAKRTALPMPSTRRDRPAVFAVYPAANCWKTCTP